MPAMMYRSEVPFGEPLTERSILLASNSETHGRMLYQLLRGEGFQVEYAGLYSHLDSRLDSEPFDMVLLEVTCEDAVELAVETALRIKRARLGQFVGYLADPALEASGLAGDGIFPRSSAKLPAALRAFLTEEQSANS